MGETRRPGHSAPLGFPASDLFQNAPVEAVNQARNMGGSRKLIKQEVRFPFKIQWMFAGLCKSDRFKAGNITWRSRWIPVNYSLVRYPKQSRRDGSSESNKQLSGCSRKLIKPEVGFPSTEGD